ncbi:aldehyde dehydrogenase family protein [Mycobacterium sp. 1274756.6]|uniref:aldehyde dehydrogenase family protein n=1 Tax=Mycobacterium sp. 1274756.6 TaxID=1834076 RepID=UPI0008012290|nr:aldehyde dehydrogenase family protein [Mycobacterium sp. 1274756.6]OBJ73610.1 aldehyde dehydrogenase [Mycobacterium sp. 1274756.6]
MAIALIDTVNRATVTVRNPIDGTVVGEVPDHTGAAVAAMAERLRDSQPEWEAIGPANRRKWLRRFQDWVLDNADHLADVIQAESGKTRAEACTEPIVAADVLHYWAANAKRFLADDRPRQPGPLGLTKKLITAYRPYPLVAVISPWNFPLLLPALDVVPALAAGAVVLLKPSELTPFAAVAFVDGWAEIGAPPVLALATGAGATGAAVLAQADFVQFTGSTATGRKIAVACAERLIPHSLELGGKDPAIVLADADVDRAANGIAWGGMANSGQVCISVERVYVEAPVYDEFVAKLTAAVATLRQGRDGGRCDHDVGPLASTAQCAIVQRHVEEAVAAGAVVATGGRPTGVGTFFQPTVLVDVTQAMTCMTEETFGPTLPVLKVADEEEAIRLANDSCYGLSATVWTADKRRGERVARRLQAGGVNVNDVWSNAFAHALPMAGWKQSGIGARSGGAAGIRKYCRPQAITVPRTPTGSREPLWFPSTPRRTRVALGVFRLTAARGRRRFGFTRRGAAR